MAEHGKHKKKWIAGAVKRPGRFKGWSRDEIEAAARNKKNKGLAAAARLALRFKSKEFRD